MAFSTGCVRSRRESLRAVPASIREAGYGVGATKWEVLQSAVLPYARAGIFGGVILSLGRALGETMAVTMVIGNRTDFASSLFGSTATMSRTRSTSAPRSG